MGKTLYILFVCGAGLGSSFAAQMAAEDVLAKYHINAKLDHVDISTAASVQPEVIITAQNFQKQFANFDIDNHKPLLFIYKILFPVKKLKKTDSRFTG